MKAHHPIVIVGAGMAGLACATRLAQAGLTPVVLDKGRGPGGRMAARRTEIAGEVVSFDHGAQYFTARDDAFRETVERWHALGVVAPWPAAGDEAWVGVPGMNGPIRAMAEPLDVRWNTRVETVSRSEAGWSVQIAEDHILCDHLLLAIPAEQARQLLVDAAPDFAQLVGRTRSAPCWAVMAAFEQRLGIAADTLRNPDAAISWAARNSSKPGRSGAETWVLHASPERSRALIDLPKEQAAERLLADFFAQGGLAPVAPLHLAAHRWLYAMAQPVAGDPARYDRNLQLGIAGDYLHSPRVEGAFVSGNALAEALIAQLV